MPTERKIEWREKYLRGTFKENRSSFRFGIVQDSEEHRVQNRPVIRKSDIQMMNDVLYRQEVISLIIFCWRWDMYMPLGKERRPMLILVLFPGMCN